MKKAPFVLAAVAVASCSLNDKTGPSAVKSPKPRPDTLWAYKTDTDKITFEQSYLAIVKATSKVNITSSVDNGSAVSLIIRNKGNNNEVILAIDKGQFLGGDDHPVSVKFDKGVPMKFDADEASKAGGNVLVLSNPAKLIRKIKKAKRLMIQVEFSGNGYKELEFDVSDFKWNY